MIGALLLLAAAGAEGHPKLDRALAASRLELVCDTPGECRSFPDKLHRRAGSVAMYDLKAVRPATPTTPSFGIPAS